MQFCELDLSPFFSNIHWIGSLIMSCMYIMPSKYCNPRNLLISLPHLLPVFPPYKPLSSIHFLLFWGLQNLTRIIYVIMDLEISVGTWWVPERIPNWRQQLPLPQNPSPVNSSLGKDRAPRVLPRLITGCWQTRSCSGLLGYLEGGSICWEIMSVLPVSCPEYNILLSILWLLTFFCPFFWAVHRILEGLITQPSYLLTFSISSVAFIIVTHLPCSTEIHFVKY